MKYLSHNFKETFDIAFEFAKTLKRGAVILARGEMGAGKTAFAKGLAKGLGVEKEITSPTFNIMMVYPLDSLLNIKDPELKSQAMNIVLIVCAIDILLEFGRSGNIPYVRCLQTVGDIYTPVFFAIICCWSVAVLGSYILSAFCNSWCP